ncbi:hypothetical protein HRbin21_00761 [bacterium HR21]|nr:hypothetical protein HRbin21_00761 [bacterium HR21]
MTHQSEHKPLLKAFLPPVPVPQDFEERLWLRRMLQALPIPTVPDHFEERLWERLHRESQKAFLRRLGLLSLFVLALGGSVAGVWHFLQKSREFPAAPLRPVVQIEPLTVPVTPPSPTPSLPGRTSTAPPQSPAAPITGGTHPLPPPEE